MPKEIVLTRLDELIHYRDEFADAGPVPISRALVPVADPREPGAFESLADAAQRAVDELRALIAVDSTRRHDAERQLERTRDDTARAARLRHLAADMQDAATRAEALARDALGDDARGRAETIASSTRQLASRALEHAATIECGVAALAANPDVQRLLAAEQARTLADEVRHALGRAERHLERREHEEARHLLTSLEQSISVAPGLIGTFETLRRRVQAVKVQAAEAALREARRLHRREPGSAIRLIEEVALAELPDELARHLYGLWLTACRRLDLLAAIHYRAGFARGAVLIPAADGRWEVVSALCLGWARGQRVAPASLRGTRPLD